MAKIYTVVKGDSLRRIARNQLGEAALSRVIADYNGLVDENQIWVGQQLLIPGQRERRPAPRGQLPERGEEAPWPSPPHGFQAIRDTFGDILGYLRDDGGIDPGWESERMARARLPFAIPLSWDSTKSATAIYCHKLVAPLFEAVFRQIDGNGLRAGVKTYGGCYVFRSKRNGVKPSTHSWGIAIDLNPNTNAMGTAGDMDPRLVELFEGSGFTWGGRWSGRNRDPMHFQYCSGY